MITLITGAPGAGKTAALVDMLSEMKGRHIYVHGIPDLLIEHVELDDPTEWPSVVPDGSVVVIDEVQTFWRPTGPGQKISNDITGLETHRHRGLDFYIITQAPRLLHTSVRSLVGRHVHLRDIGVMGRFWYEWPECDENCSKNWKNAPIKKRYRLPKKIFGQYKSASEHIKPVRTFPMLVPVAILALIFTVGMVWFAYTRIAVKFDDKPVQVVQVELVKDVLQPQQPVAYEKADHEIASYEMTAYIPRLAARPETAPAYDHLREVVVMPRVVGGICTAAGCDCYTQQSTRAEIPDDACRSFIASPPFNPYLAPPQHYSERESVPMDGPIT